MPSNFAILTGPAPRLACLGALAERYFVDDAATALVKLRPSDYISLEAARIRAGDLLRSRANTIELVGAVALVERVPRDLLLSDKVLRLVVPEDAKRRI